MKIYNNITQERLKELLHYNPETGIFIWLVRIAYRIRIGDIAGYNSEGCIKIMINGDNYYAHRLAWRYMTGEWPSALIDHCNTIRNDNRWKNLREATYAINNQNQRKAHKNNNTGLLGVRRSGKFFQAEIKLHKKSHYLGTFTTPELAYEAYLKAKRDLHPGCTL